MKTWPPVEERFHSSFDKTPGCWLWKNSVGSHGYGQIYHDRKLVLAHRFSWIFHKGKIPKGKWVLHSCDTKRCVNPKHLFLGSQTDNNRDMYSKKRAWSQIRPAQAKAHGHRCRKFLPHMPGEKNPLAKLSHKKVELAKKWLGMGYTKTSIAARFGVSRTAILLAVTGKTWKPIEAHRG